MTTKLDIFNRALAELGHNRTLASTDTAMIEYIRLENAWDGARISILSAHEWNWLVAETALTEGAICTEDGSREGKYYWSRPLDQIRILAVVGEDGRRVDYDTANQLIYADVPYVRFRYLPDSEDPDDWPVHVRDAIAYELAARIALPMSASGKSMVAMKQLSAAVLSLAISHDAAESRRAGTAGSKYAASRR